MDRVRRVRSFDVPGSPFNARRRRVRQRERVVRSVARSRARRDAARAPAATRPRLARSSAELVNGSSDGDADAPRPAERCRPASERRDSHADDREGRVRVRGRQRRDARSSEFALRIRGNDHADQSETQAPTSRRAATARQPSPSHDATRAHRAGLPDRRRDGAVDRLVQPVRESAHGARAARERLAGDCEPARLRRRSQRHGKIPFICFDLAGGANMAGSNVLVGKQQRPARHACRRPATASSACRATRSRASPKRLPTATSNGDHTDTSLGLAFHSDSAFLRGMQTSFKTRRHRRKHQRRRDPGALRERHEQQSAQSAVRHPARGRGRRDPHVDRLAELGLGRQLDGAGDDDQSGVPADEGRPAERRDRPRRHERSAEAAGPRGRGRRAWRPSIGSASEKINNVTTGLNFPDPTDGAADARPSRRGAREVRLPRRRLRHGKVRQRRAGPGARIRTSSARPASSRTRSSPRPARTATSSARPRRS